MTLCTVQDNCPVLNVPIINLQESTLWKHVAPFMVEDLENWRCSGRLWRVVENLVKLLGMNTLCVTKTKSDAAERRYQTKFVQHGFAGEEIVPRDTFYAYGWGGQYIVVIPSLDVVVVQLGSDKEDDPINYTKPMWRDLISAFSAPAA
jgi:CubicO group peptidase (beta-lactamase class C family)